MFDLSVAKLFYLCTCCTEPFVSKPVFIFLFIIWEEQFNLINRYVQGHNCTILYFFIVKSNFTLKKTIIFKSKSNKCLTYYLQRNIVCNGHLTKLVPNLALLLDHLSLWSGLTYKKDHVPTNVLERGLERERKGFHQRKESQHNGQSICFVI